MAVLDTEEQKRQQKYRDEEEKNTLERAAILGLQYLDTRSIEATAPLAKGILENETMYKGKIIPLRSGGGAEPFIFGVTSSTPKSVMDNLKKEYGDRGLGIRFLLISDSGYRAFMRRFDPPKEVVYDDVEIAREGDSSTIEQVSKTFEEVRTDDILDYLIEQADRLGASDIHIENQRENVRIRFRVDGALHPIAYITHQKYRVLLVSIASRANISTAAKGAQAGHMFQHIERDDGETRDLNMRIETIPTVYGQDAVIRLFNFDESLLHLDNLGINEHERAEIDEIISHPRGMVLMVGPTGSGKSTTLYSMINALNSTERKIITLEDPVEYSIPGISQIPVDTSGGESFAENLRAVLRLDPDIIMVGEIRDVDAARTAIQASITGHLVLSTFHANTASAAFSRMIDMIGINPIFSTAIRLVIGQRLVRRLDDDTKQEYEPDEATKNWIRKVLSDLPEHADKPDLENIKLWKPVTTPESPFGYKGRTVLMEQMVVGPEVQKFLHGEVANVNIEAIEAAAKKEGMVTLLQAGVLKALSGETTLEEVNRVI